DGVLVITAPGLLANDSDPEHPFIYITTITDPSHGSLAAFTDGPFTYRPHTGYSGQDTFTYRINDSANATSNTATVAITVTPVDDA
ncbi:hypothetical protein C6A85_59945, partial [Mycobacterium sp. ITM-2017-0098]